MLTQGIRKQVPRGLRDLHDTLDAQEGGLGSAEKGGYDARRRLARPARALLTLADPAGARRGILRPAPAAERRADTAHQHPQAAQGPGLYDNLASLARQDYPEYDGWTLERFVSRHLRWAQMRRCIAPGAFVGELLLNPVLWLSLAVAALGLDVRFIALAACGAAVKCAADAALIKRLSGRAPRPLQLLLIPFKDLLNAGIWAVAFFRREVNWRGNRMRIGAGSVLA